MGNINLSTLPLPTEKELERVHEIDPSFPPALGHNHGVPLSMTTQTKVIVNEKLFSWSGDAFVIKHDDGRNLGSDLQIKGTVFTMRDKLVLLNGVTKKPVCIAGNTFSGCRTVYKIYTTTALYAGQNGSPERYDGSNLFLYASVERESCSSDIAVHLAKDDTKFAYTVLRTGEWWPCSRVVRRDGITCAFMSGGNWDYVKADSYKVVVNPGIDTCLMVMICVICDKMEENDTANHAM